MVPAWEYQWLVAVPLPGSSGVLPLEVDRRSPSEATPTALALRQLRSALGRRSASGRRPVVTFDSNYDAIALAQVVQREDPAQRLDADVLVRLAKRRRFCRPAPAYAGKGRPRKHRPVFRLRDPRGHGTPDRSASGEDPRHGRVQVDVWEGLHVQRAAATPLTVVRVQVERLPQAGRKPGPWWLVWPA